MFKCSSKKVAFIHIPKTAGTSIKRALFGICNDGQIRGFQGDAILDCDGWVPHKPITKHDRQKTSLHFFTVVRNPWARYASMFRRKKALGHARYRKLTFFEWTQMMDTLPSVHWQNQLHYISERGNLLVDTVLRFETLATDFALFSVAFNLNVNLPERNYKSGGQYDYRDYYDSKTRQAIEPRVVADAEKFGYGFEHDT